jgi:putative SOS response-associated peptidase YedK
VITTDANALVADIHDRMPLILAPEDYGRWLCDDPTPPTSCGRPERRRQCEGLARLDAVIEVGVAVPSARAATIVLAMAGRSGVVSSSNAAC